MKRSVPPGQVDAFELLPAGTLNPPSFETLVPLGGSLQDPGPRCSEWLGERITAFRPIDEEPLVTSPSTSDTVSAQPSRFRVTMVLTAPTRQATLWRKSAFATIARSVSSGPWYL